MSTITEYVMNPAEDTVLYGDELADGMWVLGDDALMRTPSGDSEDEQIRAQRFRRVTRLRLYTQPGSDSAPPQMSFIGEWADGYQQSWEGAITSAWIVKREQPSPRKDER